MQWCGAVRYGAVQYLIFTFFHVQLLAPVRVLTRAAHRFVTGFCDSIQSRYRKLSMHELATELAMPARFVEMRHQATHKELPSLIRLKDIAAEALHWLWGWYWGRLDELVGGFPDEASRRENLRLLREGLQLELKKYLSARRVEVKRGVKGVKRGCSEAGKEAGLRCVRYCLDKVEYLEVLVELLVDERAVIPSDKQLGSTMKGAFLLWDELLRRLSLHQWSFLRILCRHMIDLMNTPATLSATVEPTREAMHEWVAHILTTKEWAQPRKRVEGMLLDDIMGRCFTFPSYWSHKLAESIIKDRDGLFQATWQPVLQASLTGPENDDAEQSDNSPIEEKSPISGLPGDNKTQWALRNGSQSPQVHAISRFRGRVDSDSDIDSDSEDEMTTASPSAVMERFRKRYKLHPQTQPASELPQLSPPGWKKWRGKWKRQAIGLAPTDSDCDG
ncbi:Las1-domain-containing protein [Glonium stellatum]|uniref:Las1-domain-containing protein n=1 Tax=Glonium stellatum TaxID=574774 RepID=A0A8E2JTJ9_9PEZI|nr:Las1-domain-containing protein [Glonium stellatum]